MNRLNRRKERLLNEIAERVAEKLFREDSSGSGSSHIVLSLEEENMNTGGEFKHRDEIVDIDDWSAVEDFVVSKFGVDSSSLFKNGAIYFYLEGNIPEVKIILRSKPWLKQGKLHYDVQVFTRETPAKESYVFHSIDRLVDLVEEKFKYMQNLL